MKYLLEINEEHAKVIIEALDVFSRIHMGQLNIIAEQLNFSNFFNKTNIHNTDFRKKIDELKAIIGLSSSGHLGIRSEVVHEDAKVAYDIQQIIRHKLAWDKNPQGGYSVDFQELFKCSKSETLPKIYGEKYDNQS